MTTYTLNQEQIDAVVELLVTSLHHMPVGQGPELVKDTNTAIHMLRKLQPNTQEPVGYAYGNQDFIGSVIGAKGEWAPNEIPLYTHPAPQQEPLTAVEVRGITASHNFEIHGDRARYIVRMTELAHGVKP